MFRKPQAIRLAGYLGFVTALTYLVMGISTTNAIPRMNPFNPVDWELQIQASAARFPEHFFGGGIMVVLHLLAGFFFLAVLNRASRLHPTTATIGGALLLSAVAISCFQRVWEVFGTNLLAVRYVSVEQADLRTAWLHAFQLSSAGDGILIAAAITVSIPGFIIMAYALSRYRLLSISFLMAGTTQFLAVLAVGYAFNVGRLEHRFDRLVLGASMVGAWLLPVIACVLASIWLLKKEPDPQIAQMSQIKTAAA